MSFYNAYNILKNKLAVIYAYNKYTAPHEKAADFENKKIHFIQKLDSKLNKTKQEYVELRRKFSILNHQYHKNMVLLTRCNDFQLKIILNNHNETIKKLAQTCKEEIDELFKHYCSFYEQRIEFEARYPLIFKNHIKYFLAVN